MKKDKRKIKTNPVAKHINTFNKPKTFVDRKKELKRSAKGKIDVSELYIE